MANMQLSALRTEVYNRLGETTGFYVNSEINQWLADGVDKLALEVQPLYTSAKVDVVASTAEYALPTDLISIKWAQILDSNSKWSTLTETTWFELFRDLPTFETDTATTPGWYYWRQDVIGLYPKPTNSTTAGLRILYTYRPAAMSADTDTSGLPEWLDRAIVLYAVFRCRLKDRDEQRAAATAVEFNAQKAEAMRILNKQRKEHAPRLEPFQRSYRQFYNRRLARPYIRVTTS